MSRDEIINGLKAGRTLILDGAATESERATVQSLVDEGIATSRFREGDQYSYYEITLSEGDKS